MKAYCIFGYTRETPAVDNWETPSSFWSSVGKKGMPPLYNPYTICAYTYIDIHIYIYMYVYYPLFPKFCFEGAHQAFSQPGSLVFSLSALILLPSSHGEHIHWDVGIIWGLRRGYVGVTDFFLPAPQIHPLDSAQQSRLTEDEKECTCLPITGFIIPWVHIQSPALGQIAPALSTPLPSSSTWKRQFCSRRFELSLTW